MHYLLAINTKQNKIYAYTDSDIDIKVDVNDEPFIAGAKMQASSIENDDDTTVGSLEASVLLDDNLTYKNLVGGELKNARWVLYEHDGTDTKKINGGVVGVVTINNKRLAKIELLDNAKILMQNIGMVDQRACRAIFGRDRSEYLGCGVDAEGMWVTHTVTSVDDFEPNGIFSVSGAINENAKLEGRVRFTSGDNQSSVIYQIDYVEGQKIRLFEATPFAIKESDTLEIRPDCNKTAEMCKEVYDNMTNYNGEPFIPVNGLAIMTPSGDS